MSVAASTSADRDLFEHAKGYYVAKALLALWRTGLLARAAAAETLDVAALSRDGYDPDLLGALLDYLTARGYFDWLDDGRYRLSARGHAAAPFFGYLPMMIGAYEPVFTNLEAVVSGRLTYGRDVERSGHELAGSLTALEQNLLGQVTEMLGAEPFRRALDLGCGSARMLCRICQLDPAVSGVGVDVDEVACAAARRTVEEQRLSGRVTIVQGDAGDVGELPAAAIEGVDLVTGMFVMHELLRQRGRDGTVACLRELARLVGTGGKLLLVEVARTTGHDAQDGLLFVPEYELFHRFSNQRLATRAEWEEILGEAGIRLVRTVPADMCQAICMVATPA